ncbi:hypothetical protein DIPPA_27738 [Diplonema papillatum]|nr:hypothetical protein DIPPA_27738 [Diplonema papillatum]
MLPMNFLPSQPLSNAAAPGVFALGLQQPILGQQLGMAGGMAGAPFMNMLNSPTSPATAEAAAAEQQLKMMQDQILQHQQQQQMQQLQQLHLKQWSMLHQQQLHTGAPLIPLPPAASAPSLNAPTAVPTSVPSSPASPINPTLNTPIPNLTPVQPATLTTPLQPLQPRAKQQAPQPKKSFAPKAVEPAGQEAPALINNPGVTLICDDKKCNHNTWDNVRVCKKVMTLRCRICQKQVRMPVEDVWAAKCELFGPSKCQLASACPKMHIHYRKENLDERVKKHGSTVLQHVRPNKPGSPADGADAASSQPAADGTSAPQQGGLQAPAEPQEHPPAPEFQAEQSSVGNGHLAVETALNGGEQPAPKPSLTGFVAESAAMKLRRRLTEAGADEDGGGYGLDRGDDNSHGIDMTFLSEAAGIVELDESSFRGHDNFWQRIETFPMVNKSETARIMANRCLTAPVEWRLPGKEERAPCGDSAAIEGLFGKRQGTDPSMSLGLLWGAAKE